MRGRMNAFTILVAALLIGLAVIGYVLGWLSPKRKREMKVDWKKRKE